MDREIPSAARGTAVRTDSYRAGARVIVLNYFAKGTDRGRDPYRARDDQRLRGARDRRLLPQRRSRSRAARALDPES